MINVVEEKGHCSSERFEVHGCIISQVRLYLPNGEEIHVTASLGCASFPSHAQSESSLLTQADKALYQAKAQGRNLVLLAQPLVTVRQYA